MGLVEGQIHDSKITFTLVEGNIRVYQVTDSKLRVLKDCANSKISYSEWAFAFLSISVALLIAYLTCDNCIGNEKFIVSFFFCTAITFYLFWKRRKEKNKLEILFKEIVSGEIG